MTQPHEITFADGTVGAFVELHEHNTEIARLTAERDQALASAAAAYERAAQATKQPYAWPNIEADIQARLSALATEAETTALAEMLDAETQACAETPFPSNWREEPTYKTKLRDQKLYSEGFNACRAAILARIYQRKEPTP